MVGKRRIKNPRDVMCYLSRILVDIEGLSQADKLSQAGKIGQLSIAFLNAWQLEQARLLQLKLEGYPQAGEPDAKDVSKSPKGAGEAEA